MALVESGTFYSKLRDPSKVNNKPPPPSRTTTHSPSILIAIAIYFSFSTFVTLYFLQGCTPRPVSVPS